MRRTASLGLVLVQVLVLVPLVLGGAALALDSFYARRAADVFADGARCAVDVQQVAGTSRTGDPLRVITDGGDCARSEQYLVTYVGVPVEQRITQGRLEVELGTTPGGVEVARPASVTSYSPEVAAALFWVGAGVTAVGVVLEVAWVRRLRAAPR